MVVELVLFSFIVLFVAIGYITKDRDGSAESYHLADRSLNKWLVGISAGATANSGFIVVGAVGMGYTMGISSLLYPLAWLIGDLLFWNLFAGKVRGMESVKSSLTVSEVLTFFNGDKNLKIISATVIFLLLCIYASSQLIASTKIVASFSDISDSLAITLSFLFVMAYTMWGGFKSSVYTDIVQGFMMVLLTLGILVWGVDKVGGVSGFFQGIEAISNSYASLLGENSLFTLFSVVLGMLFTSLGFSLSQPQVITRVFAAKDEQEVQSAKWIYISFLHFTWIGMSLIGMVVKLLLPDIADAEIALPILSKEHFSDVIVGFVFASMIATVLSSVDSMIVSAASIVSLDFEVEKRGKNTKRLHKIVILGVGFVTLFFALFLKSTVFTIALYSVSIMSASIGSAMIMLIVGITNRANVLKLTILTGLFSAIGWRVFGLNSFVSETFIGMFCAILVGYLFEIYQRERETFSA